MPGERLIVNFIAEGADLARPAPLAIVLVD